MERIGRWIAGKLERPSRGYEPFTRLDLNALRRALQPADVLLVEGNSKLSSAIKYLTQSTWSHAALYVGRAPGMADEGVETRELIEANLDDGVVAVSLSKYDKLNCRICRPVGLTDTAKCDVIEFMIARIGHGYDARHVVDLARYLLPTPPVPVRWRRRMLELGSGDPTRTICSTLIAEAFQSVHFPILPQIEQILGDTSVQVVSP